MRAAFVVAAFVVAMVVAVVVCAGLIAMAINAGAAPVARQSASPPPSTTPAPTTSMSVPALTNQVPALTAEVRPAVDCVPLLPCQSSAATTTTTTPCRGEDCIPSPPTSAPRPDAPEQEDAGPGEELDCGMTDLTGCMAVGLNVVFRGLVQAALSPILDLLAATALSTPTIDQLPGIGELWQNSFGIVVAVYGLLVLVGGMVVMSHESLQTRYSIKEIGPRIPVAFVASMLSLFFADKLIRLANAFSTAVLGADLSPPALGDTLNEAITGAFTGGLFLLLTALVLVIVGIGLLVVYVIRVMLTVVLVIAGPLFLMFHALPHTDPLARWWWKATTTVLAIQVGQSLVLIVAVKTLLSGGVHLFTSFGSFGTMIGAIGLFIVLFKIPFWLFAAVKVSSGRSLIGGLARAYVAAKTFGLLTNRSGNRGSHPSNSGGGQAGRGGQGSGRGLVDPYARVRVTADGQYMLPLIGLRRTRPAATRQPVPTPRPHAVRGRQLALPLGNDWSENRPVLGRDGQYRLPLDVQRVQPTPPPVSGHTTAPRGRSRGRQLEFRFDPYQGNRPNHRGQYPLPLDGVQRQQATSRPPSPPPPAPAPRTRATQSELPFDPYKGNRPNRGGQYALPLDGVRRVPLAKPAPTSSSARSARRVGRQLRLPLDMPTPPHHPPPPSPQSGGKP